MNETNSNRIKKLLNGSDVIRDNQNNPALDFDFSNETILITGAAGTIGSGLAKLLIHTPFKHLILLDNAETPLYYLQNELERLSIQNIDIILSDIRYEDAMNDLFKNLKPSIIFHTAAYKHVPLMESNPYEAVKLNIFGTKLLADLAIQYQTKKMVFISTDKAVHPISVMGMTKRIAEMYLEHLNKPHQTQFVITRFGNVLGSNGSLIPLFKKQIERDQAITVTDSDVSRYFINKDKACQLILKIAHNDDWEYPVLTFDMGKPIKIMDVAKTFIKLHHTNTDNKIAIKLIGLRPGEKLHEDIIATNEQLKPTQYQDILYVVKNQDEYSKPLDLTSLQGINSYQKPSEIKAILSTYCR
ncbi:polysaccharide biosynthesis protein [Yeosuana marina]|uniref:polysaccharide biosynthesis protein n=1 Tax=Yeosuana marina TaxID=1565536 RepID=UPI0030EEAF71|tara:strand:+ start:1115 stop:2185 length:1071 start_codon:yes stop_codon:yes gene_type:complete